MGKIGQTFGIMENCGNEITIFLGEDELPLRISMHRRGRVPLLTSDFVCSEKKCIFFIGLV
jgi:hypothetical protein